MPAQHSFLDAHLPIGRQRCRIAGQGLELDALQIARAESEVDQQPHRVRAVAATAGLRQEGDTHLGNVHQPILAEQAAPADRLGTGLDDELRAVRPRRHRHVPVAECLQGQGFWGPPASRRPGVEIGEDAVQHPEVALPERPQKHLLAGEHAADLNREPRRVLSASTCERMRSAPTGAR